MSSKKCFMDATRPCDLTCKAAFEVDDPVDNVDCYFIWLAYHLGEGFFEMRRALDGSGPGGGFPGGTPSGGPGGTPGTGPSGAGPTGWPGFPGSKGSGPKGFSNN